MEVAEDIDDFDFDFAKPAVSLCTVSSYTPLLRLYLFFLFMFQSIFHLSDNALDILLKFLSMFFKTLAKVASLPESFLKLLPSTTYSARKLTDNKRDQFVRYVSCPDCHFLYTPDDCIIKTHGDSIEAKTCSFVQFPTHPQAQHRRPCGGQLMKQVKGKNNVFFYPCRVYTYKSLIDSLQDMLQQPEFSKKCEEWRSNEQTPGTYSDIYDGKIWKEFLIYDDIRISAEC